jgi:hypothetical protein
MRQKKNLFLTCEKTCLRHVTNINGFPKEFKPASIERFCKKISQLIMSGHKSERYHLGLNQITNKVMPDVYVLSARLLNWILGNICGTCILAMNCHGTLRKTIVR